VGDKSGGERVRVGVSAEQILLLFKCQVPFPGPLTSWEGLFLGHLKPEFRSVLTTLLNLATRPYNLRLPFIS
jgi:hypothetical protein